MRREELDIGLIVNKMDAMDTMMVRQGGMHLREEEIMPEDTGGGSLRMCCGSIIRSIMEEKERQSTR